MKEPLVVIAGRPNVGKSTLFNRLTKSSDAIVDDVSGVTRDRHYGEAEWNGRRFKIIDTGGYVPDSDDKFEAAIREQVEIALDEADAILFVTDGRTGISPFDHEIAKLLRKSDKISFLLVNKLDAAHMSHEASEFYRLGIEDVYDISAINGRNLGDLLDAVIEKLDFSYEGEEEDNRLHVSILGKPNVGKSSLTNALLGVDRSIVTDIPGTTRDSINSVLKYYGEEIVLVDTAGLRRKARVHENVEFYSNVRTLRALGESDVCIILVDAQEGVQTQDQKIINEAMRRKKGIIIAVNKWDLIEKDHNTARDYEAELRYKLGYLDYAPVMFISALTKQRIFKLIDKAKEVAENRKKKVSTSKLNNTLLPELAKTPPPATPTGKEVKIRYITTGGVYYPIFIVFANEAKHIPDSYKRFMEKLIRSHFGYEGVPLTIAFKDKMTE